MSSPFWVHLLVPGVCLGWALWKLGRMIYDQRSRRPHEDGFPYVYIEEDGSARELSQDERDYLQEEFEPGDGARPYIKGNYEERTPDNRMSGFLLRRQLPENIVVRPFAPSNH